MQPVQPKITQKLLLRSAIAIFILAGLLLAYQWFKGRESDPLGGQTHDTVNYIAAIETVGDSRQAVVFKPDGTIIRQSGVPKDSQDRDVTWRPDGNFVAFASNREKGKFTMYRWLPDGRAAEMRSHFGPTQGSPYFLRSDAELHDEATALITGGGKVFKWEPKIPALRQVLPPPDPKSRVGSSGQGEGEGELSPFEAFYERLGTSFRAAKWTPDKSGVYAVMLRETGEILIFQRLDFSKPEDAIPRVIVAGDKIDFDVDQESGNLYFTVQNFQWPSAEEVPPQFKLGHKVTTPYRHAVGMLDAKNPAAIAIVDKSYNDKKAFGSVRIAPDGKKLIYIQGAYEGSGNLTPSQLVLAGLGSIVVGAVHEPSWSPDSKTITYVQPESATNRAIYTWSLNDRTPRLRSTQAGVFSNPVFSPQMSGG